MSTGQARPDYGVDAPEVIRNFFLVGVPATLAGLLAPRVKIGGRSVPFARPLLCAVGLANMGLGSMMIAYALRGKLQYRDLLLDMIDWQGDERVLDIGAGRGLLLIGAAKRLTTGKAIGIDIWSAKDLSGNSIEHAMENVTLEGVEDRVELRSEDVRSLSFADESFDVVLSNLCLHNIENAEERAQACREIARVLKPGARALISDYMNTAEYARALEKAGLRVKRSKLYLLEAYGPMRVVIATK